MGSAAQAGEPRQFPSSGPTQHCGKKPARLRRLKIRGRVDAVAQEWIAWSSSSGHGGPFRTKGSLYGRRMRSAWGQGGG